jgi:hypothetical protein
MRKLIFILTRLLVVLMALLITAPVGYWMAQLAQTPPYPINQVGADVVPQLNNIGRRLRAGEGDAMQNIFPEGWFFSHVLYGMSWVNVGLVTKDETLRQRAISEVIWVLAQSRAPKGLAPFRNATQVPNGVFYLGWSNRLLGGLLLIQRENERDPAEVARFVAQSKTLAQAFEQSPHFLLDAYPGQAWPCDNVMAMSSLAVYDKLFGKTYQPLIARFVKTLQNEVDPATDLIAHKTNASAGKIEIAPRASSQVYIHMVLPELDPTFAKDQYAKFRAWFGADVLGFPVSLEYPKGVSGRGDVDTGPLIFGISPTGTGVSIAAARANEDANSFARIAALSEMLGLPRQNNAEKDFVFGKLIVADAFLVYGKSLTRWSGQPTLIWNEPQAWRTSLYFFGVAIFVAAWLVVFWVWRKTKSSRPTKS